MVLPQNVKLLHPSIKTELSFPYEAVLADENGKEYVYRVLENRCKDLHYHGKRI